MQKFTINSYNVKFMVDGVVISEVNDFYEETIVVPTVSDYKTYFS